MNQLEDVLGRWGTGGSLSRPDTETLVYNTPDGAVTMKVTQPWPDAILLQSDWQAPVWLAQRESQYLPSVESLARAVADQRLALLSCQASASGVSLSIPLYLDGASRQAFMIAVSELARGVTTLARVVRDLDAQRASFADAERSLNQAEAAAQQAEAEQRQAEAAAAAAQQAAAAQEAAAAVARQAAEAAAQQAAAQQPVVPPPLASVPAPAPAPAAAPVSAAAATCRNCGAQIAPGQRFCMSCGTPAA